jgi:hypothetical protein
MGWIDAAVARGPDLPEATAAMIDRWQAERTRFVPGFGHRFHKPEDPRAPRLLALVDEAAAEGTVSGRFAAIGRAIQTTLNTRKGKPVPMNIDGATAVIYAELGFAGPLARGLFCLSRSVGALAHAWEQMQQGGPQQGPHPARLSLDLYRAEPDRGVTLSRLSPVQVADRIKDWVVERDLKTGARLPNEAEMIAQFGVSKGTVREAMRILEAQGLIVTRTGPGGGSFVGEVTADRAKALLANYFYFKELSVATSTSCASCWNRNSPPPWPDGCRAASSAELRGDGHAMSAPRRLPRGGARPARRLAAFHERLAEFGDNPLLAFIVSPSWRGC